MAEVKKQLIPIMRPARVAARIVGDVSAFAFVGFLGAKAFRFLFIAFYNLATDERVPGISVSNSLTGDGHLPYSAMYSNWGTFYSEVELQRILSLLVVAPLVESAVFCALVWKLCMSCGLSTAAFIAISASTFSLWHFPQGFYAVPSALIVGVPLAMIFAKYAKQWHIVVGFWMAALTHAGYNVLVGLV